MFFYISVLAILIAASVEDFMRKEIPILMPVLCLVNSALSVAFCIYTGNFWLEDTIMSLLPGVVLLLIGVVTGQAVGYGDGLMTLCIAPALGLCNTCLGLIVALGAAAFTSIILLVVKKGSRHTKIPFMPFLTLGVGVIACVQI